MQLRYTLVFVATLLALMTLTFLIVNDQASYLDTPFDFLTMAPEQRLSLTSLDRKQQGSIKFGFLEHFSPPRVGLFGNHQFQYFGQEAFGPNVPAGYFFNFWYANLGLPEIRHLLDHLAEKNKLPKLVLIQITTPNNDNGRHILGWGGELPDRYVNPDMLLDEGPKRFIKWLFKDFLLARINTDIDVNKLISALSQWNAPEESGIQRRLISPSICSQNQQNPYCIDMYGYRPDGSMDVPKSSLLIKNGDSLSRQLVLVPGDKNDIAHELEAIDDLVKHAGSRAIFIIPPVYEDARSLQANDIFNRGMELTSGLTFIDHRALRENPELF
ncbi:MAG: hypothetical protein KKB70_04650, partial [Proteobacteria bacterium]|nr:hypothetical protein [Pseudomonadota bacterium]